MHLIPNSYGVRLREFNPCHDTDDGKFSTKGSGNCQGTAEQKTASYKALKAEWAHVNNDLLEYVDRPDHPAVQAKMDTLKSLVKRMYDLDMDTGGAEGIGMPGGPRDMVIVGAGPGGLTAAVMGGTDSLDTLYIDASHEPGGQSRHSSRIENYPGFPIGTTGAALAGKLHEQAQRVGAEAKLGVRVESMTYDEETGLKTIKLSNGETVESRSVILAGGLKEADLAFEGSRSTRVIHGDGQQLARESVDKPVVVIGGSNGAAQAALGAARKSSQVTVLSRSPIEKSMSDYQVQALLNHPRIRVVIDEIAGLNDRTGLATTKKGLTIPAHRVGVFVGGVPNTGWLPSGIQLAGKKIAVNGNLETSIPGVFAIGDIREGSIGRIGTAVGDGQMAVRNVFDYFQRSPGAFSRKKTRAQ